MFLFSLFSELLSTALVSKDKIPIRSFYFARVFVRKLLLSDGRSNVEEDMECENESEVEYIESILTFIIPRFIIEEGYDLLRMMSCFLSFLRRKTRREERLSHLGISPRLFKAHKINGKNSGEELKHLCLSES